MSAPPRSTSLACTISSCRPAAAPCPTRSAGSRPGCSTLRPRQGLYSENPRGVEISGGVLYRAAITIPSQVPVGTYTAETFLIDRGKVIAAATRDIQINKSGFERFVALAARRHGVALRPDCGALVARSRLGRGGRLPAPFLGQARPKPILTALA